MRVRTGYSFKKSFAPLPKTLEKIKALGWPAAPISDRVSTYGFTYWNKLCEAEGIRPVFGVEIGVVRELGQKKPPTDYWTFFAVKSLASLNALVYEATGNPGKEPTLTYDQAIAAQGLLKIMGSSPQVDLVKPTKDLFASLSPTTTPYIFDQLKGKGFKFVACSDNNFIEPDDIFAYGVAFGRLADTQTYPQHLVSDEELAASISHVCDAGEVTKAAKLRTTLLKRCKAKMEKAEFLKANSPKTLEELCRAGAKKVGVNLKDPVYSARLERELSVIKAKEFEDYFFIIADLVAFAKPRMVVGPARGSSCGSLVCYLLGITTVDPIEWNLIFERFIDINRSDWPDIDIDFSDTKRHLVFEYAEKKYGFDHVARLGSVGLFKSKSAINQAGKVLQVPQWRTDKFAEVVGTAFDGDERALHTIEDALKNTQTGHDLFQDFPEFGLAAFLEGHPTNASQHAAGVLITNRPITDHVAVNAETGSAMCNKKDAETLGLLKIDALGLSQLSVFERAMELIDVKPVSGWHERLPLDDPKAFEIINSGKLAGVFQLTGRALRGLSKGITFETLEDIVAVTALARPGPLSTGGAQAWSRRRMGSEKVSYPHEAFEPILKPTLGVITYQEQVMQMAREVGQMAWPDVIGLRKAVGVKLGPEVINKYRDKWIEGGMSSGVPEVTLNAVWNDILAYGAYAFNRSHAVAYALISYWCCWWKAHHPAEYAAAMMDGQTDPEKQIALLRELASEGVGYIPFDRNRSTDRWSVSEEDGRQILIGPLTTAHGVGAVVAKEIMTARRKGQALRPVIEKKVANPVTKIDTITPVADRLSSIDLRKHKIISPKTPIEHVSEIQENEVLVIGILNKVTKGDDNEPERVARRGRRISGPSAFASLIVADDTGDILCRVSRSNYERLQGQVDKLSLGRSLIAIKGRVPQGIRMIDVQGIRELS